MATKIYISSVFDNLTTQEKYSERMATYRDLIGKDANGFLRLNFKRGDLVEILEGVSMIDKNFNAMKPGYHIENPERAAYLAGI